MDNLVIDDGQWEFNTHYAENFKPRKELSNQSEEVE